MIDNREPAVRPGMKEFGCIRRLALDAEQDVESGSAGWRNRRVRVSSFWFHVASMTEPARAEKKFVLPYEPSLSPG